MSLRELGAAVGGMEYHAGSKALTRVEQKADKSRSLRVFMDKIEKKIV